MNIKDITSENYEQFRYVFWLDWSNKVKYIDLFKRGITSGETLGLFFIKDAKAVLELTRYYKDFKKIVIYDAKGTINLLKDYDSINEFNDPRVEYIDIGQDLPMKFDKIIMNPPYSLGNKVTETILSSLNDNGDCVCLMPLSQYKRKDLYRHVDSFELVDPSLFEDARIGSNLAISGLSKREINKYTWNSLLFASLDQRYIEFYKYNYLCGAKYKLERKDSKQNKPFSWCNSDLDFIDTGRCISLRNGYGYHAKSTYAYRWNVTKKDLDNEWLHCLCYIHFNSKKAKDNFCKYAYNYNENKYDCLASRVLCGANAVSTSNDYFFVIPQIDWENIHINQKELWDKGDYDEAVLSEMGLKWQGDSIVER